MYTKGYFLLHRRSLTSAIATTGPCAAAGGCSAEGHCGAGGRTGGGDGPTAGEAAQRQAVSGGVGSEGGGQGCGGGCGGGVWRLVGPRIFCAKAAGDESVDAGGASLATPGWRRAVPCRLVSHFLDFILIFILNFVGLGFIFFLSSFFLGLLSHSKSQRADLPPARFVYVAVRRDADQLGRSLRDRRLG